MPPASDGGGDASKQYTVGCRFDRLVVDPQHQATLKDAVQRTHRAVLYVTELLNLHVRRLLDEDPGANLKCLFDANWIHKAFTAVTTGTDRAALDAGLVKTRDELMPAFDPPSRTRLPQVLGFEARNLAAVASNNVWMHFRRRVSAHVHGSFALPEDAYKALSKDERRARRLGLMQVADDLQRPPNEPPRSPADKHAWIATERARLGIDAAVGDWDGKPLLHHLKVRPWKFVRAMRLMSEAQVSNEKGAAALFPLRRSMVPRHIRLDQAALRALLKLGASEHVKEQARKRQKTGARSSVDLNTEASDEAGGEHESGAKKGPCKRVRRSQDELLVEQADLFARVVDLRSAGVAQRHRFDFSFTTDGVGARLLFARPKAAGSGKKAALAASAPRRGLYCIDELKRLSRANDASGMHVVGIDPGMRELVCAVDRDDPKNTSAVRYTLAQRRRDLRTAQAAAERALSKPGDVGLAEQTLSETDGIDSRSPHVNVFRAYLVARRERLEACLEYYGREQHRRRRWKTAIKTQQSEERLYERLRGMHKADDARPMVLAYGAWGAKDASACIKKGTPPAIGVGLMRKLSRRFVVAITPEHGTSSTCEKCLGPAGPWKEKELEWGKRVRGLRVCQDESCGCPLNRDRSAASLIGLNFERLMRGQSMIRQMSEEEREFHRLNVAVSGGD